MLLSTHCIGHIMTDSWKGRGNQYIDFVKVLYCKLPTNSKQLPAFPLEVRPGTTLPPWPPFIGNKQKVSEIKINLTFKILSHFIYTLKIALHSTES